MRKNLWFLMGGLVVLVGCTAVTKPESSPALLSFAASAPAYVRTISITVSGPGIDTLVFNFAVDANGTATGMLSIPAGSARLIVGRAFDSLGVNTHRGDTTLTLIPGTNPPLALVLRPLTGDVSITVTFGSFSVAMSPGDVSVFAGDTVRYTATVTNEKHDTIRAARVGWASTNTAVATIDTGGLVTTHSAGVTSVSASYGGASDQRTVTVSAPLAETIRIAFQSDVTGNQDIFTADPDGNRLSQLTANAGDNFSPKWSPDRSRIAWYATRHGRTNDYVMNADGSGVQQLTPGPSNDGHPSWSPDGTMIAYQCSVNNQHQVCTMNADGTNVVQLTNTAFFSGYPTWSPNGSQLVFESNRDGNWQIYEMNADGTGETRITNNTATDHEPEWGPTGKIAFWSDRDGNNQVYVMDPDGTNVVRLTNDPANDQSPHWSRLGTKLAFASDRSGHFEIYLMNPDGSDVVRVPTTAGRNYAPAP